MSVEKFKIIDLVKEFITVADENLINFPKKEIELKQEIKRRGYDLLLAVNEANVTSDETKRRNLIESAIALVKQLDFLIKTCAEKQIINYRKYYKFGEKMDQIIRYLVGWLRVTMESIKKNSKALA